MSNDNNTPITNLADVRKALAAGVGKGPSNSGAEPTEGPDVLDFEAAVITGAGDITILNFRGYIVATGVFVGFANETGALVGVIPIDRLVYVIEVDGIDELELVQDDAE